MKNFFSSKINISALILTLVSLQSQLEGLDLSKMTLQSWVSFGLGVAIMVFRTYFTNTTVSK